jgi:hypothetical protein
VTQFSRRRFLEGCIVSGVAGVAAANVETLQLNKSIEDTSTSARTVDFRYAPRLSQATICFPDDPNKSLVGQLGDLRYDFAKGQIVGGEDFGTVCTFSFAGMQDDRVARQWIEDPRIPIVHTLIERPTASLELIAFATRHGQEGRVDNVLLTILPKKEPVAAIPRLHIKTCRKFKQMTGPPTIVVNDLDANQPFLFAAKIGTTLDFAQLWEEAGYTLYLPHGEATTDQPFRYLVRFPQEAQAADRVSGMAQKPDELVEEAREYWKAWKPFGKVSWSYPGKLGNS